MTQNKKVLFGKVAGVSLLSIVMIFAAAAPSMTQVYAGPIGGSVVKMLGDGDLECETGIEIVKTATTACSFLIDYIGSPAIVEDTVPAEWEVISIESITDGDCTFESAGKKADKSATKITCAETSNMVILVSVETRESPATKNNPNKDAKFKPTSCGPFPLNDGAVAYASLDNEKILVDDGQGIGILIPIVIDVSDPIILDAVNPDDPDCIGLPEPDDD